MMLQMKILYGVVGEGMGHAIRSSVVLDHLVAEEHDVEVIASGRAVDFLQKRFDGVHRIHGYHMIYEDNRVRRGKTVWSNILSGAAAVPEQIKAYFGLVEDFEPEVVVSDFESWTYLFAKAHRLPIFSIDNMQIINRCAHAPDVVADHRADFEATKAFVKSKLPFCDHYLITSFFRPEVRKEDTSLYPPILRDDILDADVAQGDHLLVYQTAEGYDELVDALRDSGIECRIYGMRRDISEEQVEGTLRYRPFSETRFVEDLATCRAVIAGDGFTLMGEAVYLRKPMLALPVGRQFEQILNARYLEQLGYGRHADTLDAETIAAFVEAIPACAAALEGYQQDRNEALLSGLDAQLDRAAAGLL